MSGWEFTFDNIAIVNIVLSCLALVVAFTILIFSFGRAGFQSRLARNGTSWFRATLGIFLLSLLLGIISLVLSQVDLVSVPRKHRISLLKFPSIVVFLQIQAFISMTMAQLELATGLRENSIDDVSPGRPVRTMGLVGYIVLTVLNVAELIAVQVSFSNYRNFSRDSDAIRTVLVLEFVLYLLLCLGAFVIWIYTAVVPQVSNRSVYFLIIAAAIASFARSMFNVVISGIWSLGLLKDTLRNLPSAPQGLSVAAVIFNACLPVLAFALILIAIRKSQSGHATKANAGFV